MSLQPYGFPRDMMGRRWRSRTPITKEDEEEKSAQRHARRLASQLRAHLARVNASELFSSIQHSTFGRHAAKLQLMALKCTSPGPPLDIILNWIALPTHRAALSALFCGDFFLARYAANYFANGLVPQNASLQRELASVGLEADRVCLHCWKVHNKVSLEDEAHVLLDCTCYSQCRSTFVACLDETNQALLCGLAPSIEKLVAIFGSHEAAVWQSFASFCSRIRQLRRSLRADFQQKQRFIEKNSFHSRRKEWMQQGRFVCRHGVFWKKHTGTMCKCMAADADWKGAAYMPFLDMETKAVVVKPFQEASLRRIGQIRAELRRRQW